MASKEETNYERTEKERADLLTKVKSKGKLDDEERQKLANKLDADFDIFLQEQIKRSDGQRPNLDSDEDWNKAVEKLKTHPAFMKEVDLSQPLSEEMEALMAIKYDDNADSYKEDGNKNFQIKKYRWAIANYTEGIKVLSPNRELNSVLYANRAASHFRLGNFRSSMNDCIFARKFKPDHMKAIARGAQCCLKINKFQDAIRWCDDGLMLEPDHIALSDTRKEAMKRLKQAERDQRKELAKERKENEEDMKLISAIQERGVTLDGIKTSSNSGGQKLNPLLLSSLESCHPSKAKVFIDKNNHMLWPVLFLYPEHGESDFIGQFDEHANFEDHLVHMFGSLSERVPWDQEGKYTPDKLEIYFENKSEQKLYRVKPKMTLATVLKNKRYIVVGGTPGFIILVKDSEFAKNFLKTYTT